MIPKRIIYCWFGKKDIPEFDQECIKSWKQYCPDYEILRIDENNFDITINDYCKEAYENKNYSFVSDVARLWALEKYGGIYLDTDIKLLQPLDKLLPYNAFVTCQGNAFYNSAPLGCDKFPSLFKETKEKLTFGYCINTLMNSLAHKKYNLLGQFKNEDEITFLSSDVFLTPLYPKKSDKTIGIHYCNGSWTSIWQGGYKKSDTFNAFEIYQDEIRDISKEIRHFKDLPKIGILKTFNRPLDDNIIYKGNYFFNEKVQKVSGDGFEISRYSRKPTFEKYKIDGNIIEVSK